MGLAILLIFLLPVGLILLVFAVIGMAGMNTFRTGKRAWLEMKPFVNDLKEKAMSAQRSGNEFAARGQVLNETFREIAGRWSFVGMKVKETRENPMARLADFAGRMNARKKH